MRSVQKVFANRYVEKLFKIYIPIKCLFLQNSYELKADVTSL